MPIFRSARRTYGNYLGHPYSVGGIGSSGSNAVTVPAPPTQQASQGSLIMGHQSPAQALQTKIRSILTQDEVAMFIAMTERVKAAMTDDEVGVLQGAVGDMLGGNLAGADQGYTPLGQLAYDTPENVADRMAIPPEGIQPGYNCLDPDMATRIVVNWLDHGDETIQDLNAINNPADPTYEQRKNFEITGGGVDYASMTDKEVTAKKSDRLRPHLSIRRLYWEQLDCHPGTCSQVIPAVNAMLGGATLREPDEYLISDGLVEVLVTKNMIAEHRKPLILAQQSLAMPQLTINHMRMTAPSRCIGRCEGPPADEIAGPSYDDILNERDKRLHDERKVREGQIELNTAARTATRFTSKGTKLTIAFPKPRANPLTGVPDPAPRALLLQEAVKGMNQVQDETLDDMAANHGTVGVHLELTEFDAALVPPGTDRWESPSATITAEAPLGPITTAMVNVPAPGLVTVQRSPPPGPSTTAVYTPTVDLATLDFDAMINEAYRTLDFTWSHCHPRDSYFSCLIMKAIEGAEEQVRMSPLNAPDMATAVGLVLAEVHAALAVSVHLPGPKTQPLPPGQLAAALPGSTVTAGGISGTYTAAGIVTPALWSNQGGMQLAANPNFQQVDEDGDEIPSIRIRFLKPNHEYRGQDGTVIEVDATGNFTIKDEAAQITYRATRMRDFNRFVNGSDLVGEFIEALGKLGANQEQAAGANLEMFIRWLVHKAAEHDKEEPPVDVPMVTPADVPAVALPAAPILITDDGVKVAELVGV